MTTHSPNSHRLGWIGTGRMGAALVTRLLRRGVDVTVYNRTRAKTESLAKLGAHVVSRPVDLADRDIVITTVSDSKDFVEVVAGPHGLLSDGTRAPSLLIDASTVSMEVSAENKKQIWAPYNFARGFCALTDDCEVQYKCTGVYNQQGESGIYFADPHIGIQWPIDIAAANTSEKDRKALSLAQWLSSPLSENIVYQPEVSVT